MIWKNLSIWKNSILAFLQLSIYHIDLLLLFNISSINKDFSNCSAGKEFVCYAGDSCLICGLGRSTGEGLGYPLQYSWASMVAQLVKNLPATWKTWVGSLGWENPLEKGKVSHPSTLARRIPWTVVTKSRTWLSNFHFHFFKMLVGCQWVWQMCAYHCHWF